MGDIQATNSVSGAVTQLKQRLSISTGQRYDFVMENDLAGRAALSILWSKRDQLHIYLVTEDPQDRNIAALHSGLTTVRTPPVVEVVSPTAAGEVVASDRPLIWAVTLERTEEDIQAALQQRPRHVTYVPYEKPFDGRAGRHPDQNDPGHELVLRDMIRDHAAFLNFFGDRFDPRDLYERSTYPSWFNSTRDITGALPPLACSTLDAAGTTVATEPFTGSLQLATQHVRAGYRAQVDFTPLLQHLGPASFDLTLKLQNEYANPHGAGALTLQVHYGRKLYSQFDVATSASELQIPLRSVPSDSSLIVAVVADRDNPRRSWSVATQTSIAVDVHPQGTHPPARLTTRMRTWFRNVFLRRQERTQS